MTPRISILGSILALCVTATGHAARIEPRLARVLARGDVHGTHVVWVFFADKGPSVAAMQQVSARSLARRAQRGAPVAAAADQPVATAYVERLRPHVTAVRQLSRWFNAVSVEATPEQIATIAQLPMVKKLDAVTLSARAPELGPSDTPREVLAPPKPGPRTTGLDYGLSLPQLQLIGVTDLHGRGLSGLGVLVAHFDNGYRLLSHQVFATTRIVATHDFVDGDVDPAPPAGSDPSWGEHGISTLSVLAGNFPGKLIGAAYGADFALARTENDASETPFEEDNWVAAMEWADSLGADVISSSVGYLEYSGFPSWTWEDMDGNTTVITRAADLATARGIVVVNAAGNSGFNSLHNTLMAPADGDSVITVGGVQPNGQIYFGSSIGPTLATPPRIKPDVVAQATAVYLAGSDNTTHYGYNSGTSFSCPLVAGVVALMLESKPFATPVVIANALRATASRAAMPDNSFGYGIVNSVAAELWIPTGIEPSSMSHIKGLYR